MSDLVTSCKWRRRILLILFDFDLDALNILTISKKILKFPSCHVMRNVHATPFLGTMLRSLDLFFLFEISHIPSCRLDDTGLCRWISWTTKFKCRPSCFFHFRLQYPVISPVCACVFVFVYLLPNQWKRKQEINLIYSKAFRSLPASAGCLLTGRYLVMHLLSEMEQVHHDGIVEPIRFFFYNKILKKWRCFELSYWIDCILSIHK